MKSWTTTIKYYDAETGQEINKALINKTYEEIKDSRTITKRTNWEQQQTIYEKLVKPITAIQLKLL